jgi:protein SCO1
MTMTDQKKGIIRTVLFTLCFIAFVVFSIWNKLQKPVILSDGALKVYGTYIYDVPRQVKPFTLLNKNGNQIDKSYFEDSWTLMFFGFTNCPDICPVTLSLFKNLREAIKGTEVFDSTKFVMVTVDPEHDTHTILKKYVEHFDSNFGGLTGDFIDIYNFASNVNAAFIKVTNDDGSYRYDHTGNIVILNQYGDYIGFIKPPFDVYNIKKAYRSIRYNQR